MQEARNNFDAMRPAPVCPDANQFMGQCQNIHISTDCYYGYHDPKSGNNFHVTTDCEMRDAPPASGGVASASPVSNARKRCADDDEFPLRKRVREEAQKEKSNDPETIGKKKDSSADDFLESLYWNIHGGHIFHLKCDIHSIGL